MAYFSSTHLLPKVELSNRGKKFYISNYLLNAKIILPASKQDLNIDFVQDFESANSKNQLIIICRTINSSQRILDREKKS